MSSLPTRLSLNFPDAIPQMSNHRTLYRLYAARQRSLSDSLLLLTHHTVCIFAFGVRYLFVSASCCNSFELLVRRDASVRPSQD